ncbi:DNA-binding SARP family transcriptional activator [Tamaricihabitans halophyticus]|uniref:DNA-binding SARP family transcriptional activator n=1 Tax=Tamaricihabitans halophyticus TaxID=1262583 RepID=A0A4R2R5M6_9PSEU|nr:BTAD domain-containing putative transcriptional regulator [Tamaricihabitans halophyticus]TCP57099.1 DNA-binding SARP family transcriptional activator [Tamaricihabitans halophyticus]
MRYSILGSMLVDGAPVDPRQVRTVLAVLLSQANQPVTTQTIAGELWRGSKPESSAAVLQGRVSTLRKLLCPDLPARSSAHVLRTRHGCYTLHVTEGELDATEFLRLADAGEAAASAGDPETASTQLHAALELWRGPALQDVGDGPVLLSYASMLEQRRITAEESLFAADIARGDLNYAISGLTERLNQDATQENFAALLIEALVAAGRSRAARETLDATRSALRAADLPIGRRLHTAAERLRAESTPLASLTPEHSAPAQVPARLADFTGREQLLARIHTELTGPGPRIVALSGPGGVGKSTAAIQAAHHLRHEFPDGQLVAELATEPGKPSEVLRRFLLAIGISAEAIPHDFVERRQLWLSRTADTQLLILLDDARDEAQIRALLPSGNACGVLVTSRRRILGLSGASSIQVDAFAEPEASQLLANIVGEGRLAAEPVAASQLLARCAGLPLAVRIVGAKLAARPHETLSELLARIRAARSQLAELRAGDLDVYATIELSYTECAEPTRATLRHLGGLHLPSITRTTVAVLLGLDDAAGAEATEALVDAQLLNVAGRDAHGQVRYNLHDLIAEFAAEQASRDTAELDAGLRRLIEHYLATARQAHQIHDPAQWWTTEGGNVLAVVRAALRREWWQLGWQLANAVAELANVCPGSADSRNLTVLALWAARHRADAHAEAVSLRRLGERHWNQLKTPSAVRYLTTAARRFQDLDQPGELARTLALEADVLAETGRVGEARERLQRAIKAAEEAGDNCAHATALDGMAGLLSDACEFDSAEACFTTALRLASAAHDQRATIAIRKRHADMLRRVGRGDDAAELLHRALADARATGDRHWEAHVLRSLGELQRFTGDIAAARENLTRSLELFTEHGHRHATAYSLRSLGDLHAQLHEYPEADEALSRGWEIFEALRDRRGQAYTLRSIGALRVRTGCLAEAEAALSRAQRIVDELSLRWHSQDVSKALAQTRHWSRAAGSTTAPARPLTAGQPR